MKFEKLKCEMCSSNDLIKKDGFYQCQYCGTKYYIEEMNKQQSPEEESQIRKIIVKRKPSLTGIALKMNCYINDEEICSLAQNESFEKILKKGTYSFKCRLTVLNPVSNTYDIDLTKNHIAKISVKQESWRPRVDVVYD